MKNNQTNHNQNTSTCYTVSANSAINNYPIKDNDGKQPQSIAQTIKDSEKETAEQDRARKALKLSNPFKGV